MKLYKQLADDLTALIRQGALKPGDRVSSVRETSRERGMNGPRPVSGPSKRWEALCDPGGVRGHAYA